jgi:branched-chain amino acid transport system permease protein
MRSSTFLAAVLAVAAVLFALGLLASRSGSAYLVFAGIVVLQYIVLATAWNILGGYCGYVNFGTGAFFAMGAYAVIALERLGRNPTRWLSDTHLEFLVPLFPLSLPTMIVIGGIVAGIVGLGMGYLTLRLRGVFFAIATLALAVVLHTFVVNWDFVGGSRGHTVIRPARVALGPFALTSIEYLFLLMIVLAVLAVWVARVIERSRLGLGFASIRDDELAAEASGVPTLRLKLIATTVSGALMGMAGAPLPFYLGYVEPNTAFGLGYSVNAIAMPMIGGATTWAGPLIGAVLLGTLQQIASVSISSVWNLLIVGLLLIAFVIAAPVGIVGLVQEFLRTAAPTRLASNAVLLILVAGFCFVVGALGIIFSLEQIRQAIQAGSAGLALLGVSGLVAGALCLTGSWGLLKLQSWAPWLASAGFLAVIAVAGANLWLEWKGVVAQSLTIGVSAAAILFLQMPAVRLLYRGDAPAKAAKAVPA